MSLINKPKCTTCGSENLTPDPAGLYQDAINQEGAPLLCLVCRNQTGSTPYNPTAHVWQIVRNSSGHYLIYDDTGHLRGQYRNTDSLAQHLVFALQEIDQLRITSPLLGTAWEDDG